MDKNAIKKYAVWARRELISRVSQKALQYGITEDNIIPETATSVNGVVLSNEEIKQRKALIERISEKGYQQVMEEVAYTWFNRFSALRFMEVNGFLPSHVRVFTDEENNFKPQILAEAINLELDGLDMEKVYTLKDANDNDALFKYLVIVQCNALNPILPGMFQRISDYTELLFPDNLLRDGSAIQQMIELIPEEDWQDAVQIIGWLYQYYNSEKKDEVFAALKKNVKITKENIPAATQLFTPDWIVRYMVENSLGRLWAEGHPNDELKSEWKYYLDEAEQEPEVQAQLAEIRKEYATITPEQIKCIDPCSGSGHILAYMFDVLVQIYETYGYTAREAVRSIVENNIYGLDIDERAAQLAYFAVMMKARQYDRRFLTRKDEDGNPDVPQPHVYAIVESNGIDAYALDYFINGDPKLKAAMDSIMKEMRDSKEYGSILNITPVDFTALYARFDEVRDDISMSREAVLNDILPLVRTAEVLAFRYDVVVTNPPYMGNNSFNAKLGDYVKANYADVKNDLFAVMMIRAEHMVKNHRFYSMITQQSWMFLSSYELLRNRINQHQIVTLVHLGSRAFDEISGEMVSTAAFVNRLSGIKPYRGNYSRLVDYQGESTKESEFFNKNNRYVASQSSFAKITGIPVAYWITERVADAFDRGCSITEYVDTFQGIITGDNDKFLRFWHEVSADKIPFHSGKMEDVDLTLQYWIPYNKGGEFRKWYGGQDYVVYWKYGPDDKTRGKKGFSDYYLREYVAWSYTISNTIATRYYPQGFLWDVRGSGIMDKADMLLYLEGLISSIIGITLFRVNNSTLSCQVENIIQLPIIYDAKRKTEVDELVNKNNRLSQDEWDSFETSWDFRKHPLVPTPREWEEQRGSQFSDTRVAKFSQLAWHYDQWEYACKYRFDSLKENEEELNRIFIDIYGLQDELSSDVADNDVTVRLADKKRDIKSLISYAVGCMFGRYSLDVKGLAYAGGEWNDSKYVTFKADKDSIIPICDDEYFSDDIVGRFVRFIEVVYGKETLNENLRFIADALGGSGQPKEVIRNYFLNDFYADHLKIYQKRPIYWLFDSGKKNGFKALVYMHRYAPDTIARMRTDYVHEQQSRYRTAIADLEQRIVSASTSERVKLNKKLKTLQEQSTEIQSYEEKIHHLADQYISIDLDDGVKKNYAIFGDVLAKIK